MKRKKTKQSLRWVALMLCLPLAVTLCVRQGWGQRFAIAAAGLRRPQSVAAMLDHRLSADLPTAAQPGTSVWHSVGDTTAVDMPTAQSVALPTITMVSPPNNQGDGGTILQKTMSGGNRHRYGIAIANRSNTTVDIAAALERELTMKWADTTEPQVLILHTHTTEGYMTYNADYYNASDRRRTDDHTRNVCAVGEAVRLTLAAHGITAIHDTTIHDSPVYTGAYGRSAKTAEAYLKKYPTIQVVLDLHRDSVMEGDTVIRPTATVDGKQAAQMMLITGVVSTEALPHPHWEQNLTLSTHWQQALDKVSDDLMRPLNTVASRYNQHLSPGWVLVEVGAEGNTIEESVYSAQILGRTLAKLLS